MRGGELSSWEEGVVPISGWIRGGADRTVRRPRSVILALWLSVPGLASAGQEAMRPVPAASAPATNREASIQEPQRWDWTGEVPAGQRIVVENSFGDVRARFGGSEGVVEIHAVLQNLHPGAAPLRVFTEPGQASLSIRVGREGLSREEASSEPKDRVDLVVRVPQGSPLAVRTRAGAIEAKGLQSDVTAESESGAIAIREVRGLLHATNRYGTTEVVLESPPPDSEQVFESLTGDLSVTLPAKANATVVAQTSATITTDVSVIIVRKPREEPSKTATATLGNGGARVLLRTRRGGVEILQRDDVEDLSVGPHGPEAKASSSDD